MPKEKWFCIDQKLWDQIDDKYKSVILGYTKSSSPSPFPSRPPGKPPFPTDSIVISTFMRCLPLSSYKCVLMSWNLTLY
jgi:hypothetical protein